MVLYFKRMINVNHQGMFCFQFSYFFNFISEKKKTKKDWNILGKWGPYVSAYLFTESVKALDYLHLTSVTKKWNELMQFWKTFKIPAQSSEAVTIALPLVTVKSLLLYLIWLNTWPSLLLLHLQTLNQTHLVRHILHLMNCQNFHDRFLTQIHLKLKVIKVIFSLKMRCVVFVLTEIKPRIDKG